MKLTTATELQLIDGYERAQTLTETTFTCGLCDQTVTEFVYPGAPPSVCACCVEKRGGRNAARAALHRKRNPSSPAQKAARAEAQRQRRQSKQLGSGDTD